jgi:hypothetical protein
MTELSSLVRQSQSRGSSASASFYLYSRATVNFDRNDCGAMFREQLHTSSGCGTRGERMAKPKDLIAVHVPTEDLGDYNVTETGWYATDDGGKVVLGPFDSLAECDRAIRDRLQRTADPKPEIPT